MVTAGVVLKMNFPIRSRIKILRRRKGQAKMPSFSGRRDKQNFILKIFCMPGRMVKQNFMIKQVELE